MKGEAATFWRSRELQALATVKWVILSVDLDSRRVTVIITFCRGETDLIDLLR